MRCDEVMKTSPAYLDRNQNVKDAAAQMRDRNVGFLPVCENNKVLGVITDRDIACRCVAEGKGLDTPITDIMSTQVVACRPGDDITKAQQLMGQAQKSRMIVTDDDGNLVGVISLSDIAQNVDDSDNVARTMREVTEREARTH